MHVELLERRVPDSLEAVDLSRLDDEDVPGAGLELLALDDVSAPAFADELDLVIGMPVGPWTGAGRSAEQEHGDAHVALLGTDEVVGVATMRQILLAHVMHDVLRSSTWAPIA